MRKPAPSDAAIAAALRQSALALAEALPDKIAEAPLHQAAAALKTAVEVIRMLEADESFQRQANPDPASDRVIRWEFVYNGAVHDAPPWAGGGDGPPGALPRRGLRPAVGQDGAGQGGAA